jgi:hypothetical protein
MCAKPGAVRDRKREKERGRKGGREGGGQEGTEGRRDRQTERQTDRRTDGRTGRQTDRDRDRDRDKDRNTEREREKVCEIRGVSTKRAWSSGNGSIPHKSMSIALNPILVVSTGLLLYCSSTSVNLVNPMLNDPIETINRNRSWDGAWTGREMMSLRSAGVHFE